MHKSSVHLSTIIILLSILTVMVQFIAYHFLGGTIITFSLTSIIILLFLHILLEQYLSYENCFSYMLLNLFMSFIAILFSYYGKSDFLITYHPELFIFIILHWIVPAVYCTFRCLFDRGPRFTYFKQFYRNISIVFLIFYIGILVKILFINNNTLHGSEGISFQFIPTITMATVIENCIEGRMAFSTTVSHFLTPILLFIPYGYYCALMLRYMGRVIRTVAFLLLPILVEVLQSVLLFSKGEIDDIILAFIGVLLGSLCYHVINNIFQSVTDEDFLSERNTFSFYGSHLHF